MTDAAAPGALSGSRWLPWTLAAIAIIGIGAILWVISANRAVISGADRRNQADLAIAAGGLEQWSGAIAGLARANFIRGRVEALPVSERDYSDGWRYRAWLRHPALGEFKIVYAVTSARGCKDIRAKIVQSEGALPFVDNYNDNGSKYLKVVDRFGLDAIWQLDTMRGRANVGRAQLRTYVANIVGGTVPRGRRPGFDDVVCFAAGIPLDRLLVLDKAARAFSNFMVIDGERRVVAQIGNEHLPIGSLDGLAPAGSILTKTLAATLGQPAPAGVREPKLADSLDPVDLDIGGRTFVAYVRPFSPPTGFDVCNTAKVSAPLPAIALAIGNARVEGTAQPPPDPASKVAAPSRRTGECLVVALVPKATIWRQVVSLPLVIGVSIGLAILILIALLPSLRLILLGPGEAIGRAGAIGVALGIPAVASLATLALLFACDLAVYRHVARQEAEAIARHVAATTGKQIADAVRLADDTVNKGGNTPPIGEASSARIGGCGTESAKSDGRLLKRNPNPVCRIADFCRFWRTSKLPVIDTMGWFDEDGVQAKDARTSVCRGFAGGRANVSARDYFVRLRNGNPSLLDSEQTTDDRGPPYVVAHVAALQDGIAKSIVGLEAITPTAAGPASQGPAGSAGLTAGDAASDKRGRQFAIATATLTTVIAPVLPPPLELMIVDTRNDALPVLLHPTPGRSGAETLARMIPNLAPVREQLRDLHLPTGATVEPASFTGFYDGTRRMFVAAPIRGTHWVAIVDYGLAEVDAIPARTVMQALQSWAAFSILSVGIWLLWLAATGRRGWPRLWPQRARESDYRILAAGFAIIAGLTLFFFGLLPWIGEAGASIALLLGLAARLTAAVALHVRLGRSRTAPSSTVLRPATQRDYMRMIAPLLMCLSVVPMIGFWVEARDYMTVQVRGEALGHFVAPDGLLQTNFLTFDRLRWAYGISNPPPEITVRHVERVPGAYGVELRRQNPTPAIKYDAWFSRTIKGPLADIAGCGSAQDMPPPRPLEIRLCHQGTSYGIDIATPNPLRDNPAWPALFWLALLAVTLVFAQWRLTAYALRALAGFGIPLGAVIYPRLFLGDLFVPPLKAAGLPPHVTLNRKSLLVNAPWIIIAMLREGGAGQQLVMLNVADPAPRPAAIVEGSIVIVTGLDLVLADRERRLRALALLELACQLLTRLGPATQARLIIMSETAPLDRILDAFERDENRPDHDAARENLRWSRLFEDFATYSFAQPRLTEPLAATDLASESATQRIAADSVLEECRWLPPRIINGGIGEEILLSPAQLMTGLVPVPDADYQKLYRQSLFDWAIARDFPGRDAVRTFLRNQFVEYYQKLWSASTDAEHLVMHHMAHQRFVNIGAATAFGSLVRRGIVVFDPQPRLMNRSFEMFVCQAEKLDTIQRWRSAQPAGIWMTARWPIFAILGLAFLGLILALIFSDEEPSALLPVLAAGIPALVTAVRRIMRQ